MPELVCNTSPIQYLHQLGLLDLLPKLGGRVCLPAAVIEELSAGRAAGVDLPDPARLDWVQVRRPVSAAALPLVRDLGPGETEVLMERPYAVDTVGLAGGSPALGVGRVAQVARARLPHCLDMSNLATSPITFIGTEGCSPVVLRL